MRSKISRALQNSSTRTMGAPSVAQDGGPCGNADENYGHNGRRTWCSSKRVVLLLGAIVLMATAICVLHRENESHGEKQQPTNIASLLGGLVSPASNSIVAATSSQRQASSNGWLLFGKPATDLRPARSANEADQTKPVRRELTNGFKWATGTILDDFALGMGPEDFEERHDRNANNNYTQSEFSSNSKEQQPTTARAVVLIEQEAHHHKESLDLVARNSSGGANKVRGDGRENVINNSNISYSKTQQDLRDARAKLEQLQQRRSTEAAAVSNQSTPLPETPLPQAPAPQNVALLERNGTRIDASSPTVAPNPSNSKTNETSASSSKSSPAIFGLEEHRRHSSAAKMRLKRRAGAIESERGKPILNEFSFPANLVQGMRFVLMCQVLDGEPPIQIKWFKDSQDLEQLLQNSRTNQDNHQQQQQHQMGPGEIGPAASKLISLIAASSSDVSSADSSAAGGAADQQQLEHIEMISNDELSSSLLFRKVKQQHGGNYTCLATNRHGASSYTSLMTVKVPPTWRVEPRNRESIMGEQITIDCQAVGNPNPFLRWKFATSVQHDKTPSAANHQAMSEAGSPTTTDQHLQQQHLHSFKLINSNHHVQTLENGSLIIRQAGKEHEGLYLCEADNGVEPSLVKQIKLIVHKQAHFLDDIQVLVQPSPGQQDQNQQQQSAVASKGLAQKDTAGSLSSLQQFNQLTPSVKVASLPQNTSLVHLVCSPHGDVPLQLDWLKDGHLIHTHSTGANLHGPDEELESRPDSGASSALLEPTSANSRYHVSSRWTTHRSLTPSSSGGLESELLIANLGRHDAGVYTCSARNAFGQSERKLRLVVQEQPEAPTMVDVARISSRNIALRWLAPFDGNSPITKYVIEYKKQSGNDNQQMSRSEKKMAVVTTLKTGSDTNLAPMMDSSFSEPATITGLRQQMAGGVQLGDSILGDRAQIQHTVHDLEPMTTYTMRVIAVNALGQSRPSVALSLRTEEEVPATVPEMVEAIVLSSSSIKLRWTISYSYEHELIDGFFIGYRSFDSSALLPDSANVNGIDQSLAANIIQESASGGRLTAKQMIERPTFTYKTIRLINQHQAQQQQPLDESGQNTGSVNSQQAESSSTLPPQQGSDSAPVVAPISSVTKTVPINSILMAGGTSKQFVDATNSLSSNNMGQQIKQNQQQQGEMALVVVSNFDFVINGLERNTEYTILIQCFNKKGTGPSSDPVVTKTLQHDPPQKLTLVANELTETSLRLNWHFPGEMKNQMAASIKQPDYVQRSSIALNGRSGQGLMELVDGFVLTFAKIVQPATNLSRQIINGNNRGQQEFSSLPPMSLPHYHPQHPRSHAYKQQQQQQQQQNQQADSAARISKQNSPTNNNFHYNPPIQPSQLLDHQWQAIQLAPQQREHVLKNLECGTWYAMKIWAFNKVGKGEASELVTVNTRGKAPVAPSRSAFLSVNSTQVKLNLNAWYDGGCEIEKFIVQYRARGQKEWILVSNNILKEQGELVIRDLSPATAYELLIGAQNHVNLSEAKYRFTSLDLDGKQVNPSRSSSSFLPTLSDDYNDENNSMIDYSDDGQYSSSESNIRRESIGGEFGFSHSSPGGHRWLMVASHVLNSPLTLLFTFCIFLVLLALLAFHRFNGTTEHRHHYNNGNSTSNKMDHDDGANGANLVRRCSLDEMATMLDGNGGGPPMSCTTNGSSTASTDSPGRMVNVHAASSGRMNSAHPAGSTYAPLDCYSSSAYCGAAVQQSSAAYGSLTPQASNLPNLLPDIGNGHLNGQRQAGNNWNGANIENYPSDQQHQNQQHVGFYSALPTANYTIEAAPLNQTTAPRSVSLDHDANHQHLMQMLLIPPQQHQQSGQVHEGYSPSMTTMALTTLARQKAGLSKTPNGVTEYNNSLLHHGPSFTLGRVPAQNQESFHSANCKTDIEEHYQMNIIDTLTRKRKALLRLDRRQQDPADLYHDTSSTNLSSSFTSTSGCGTATASTSQSGGIRLDPIGDQELETP